MRGVKVGEMAAKILPVENSLIERLKKVATGGFTCGGVLEIPTSVQLAYAGESGQWKRVTFPGVKDADIQDILKVSKVASFGRGKEELTDKTIRDAYVLDPDKFLCSLQLSNTEILDEIKTVLVPDFNIRTELYKLNIYTSPAGHFKSHVDTPRGRNMFGSLVVCLPSQFNGGALITRHGGQQITYNWSSPADDPVEKIQWAAFFSDVRHEILPVSEGYRVTLTFNLYHCDQISLALDSTSPFYSYFKTALDNPHFLREGGTLGFGCHHVYVFEEFNKGKDKDHVLLLKGSDRMIFSAAKSLGLSAKVKPILENSHVYRTDDPDAEEEEVFEDLIYAGQKFELTDVYAYDKEDEHLNWKDYFEEGDYDDASSVIWCRPLKDRHPSLFAADYGNMPECGVTYQAAAILITIPKWGERSSHTS